MYMPFCDFTSFYEYLSMNVMESKYFCSSNKFKLAPILVFLLLFFDVGYVFFFHSVN